MSNAYAYGVAYNATDCYNRGNVTATSNDSEDGKATAYGVGDHVKNCYSTGNVYALGNSKTKVVDAVGKIVSNGHYLDTVETSTVGKTENGRPKTEAEMKTEPFATKLNRVNWMIDSSKNDGYPIQTEEESIITEISYIEDLLRISLDSNVGVDSVYRNKVLKFTRDLDFNDNDSYRNYADTSYGDINNDGTVQGIKEELTDVNGEGFPAIGSLSTTTFDGQNHKLLNLYMNKSEEYNVTLFGSVATVENLGVTGTIKADKCTNISGIVGSGIAKNCYSDIDIIVTGVTNDANNYVAGINRYGQALFCYNLGNISVQATNTSGLFV